MSRAFLWANSWRGPLEWLLYTPKESRKGLMVGYDISHENTDFKMDSTEQTQNKPRNRFPKFCLQVCVNLIEQDTAIFTSVQKLRTHHVSKSCKMQLNRDCSKKTSKNRIHKKTVMYKIDPSQTHHMKQILHSNNITVTSDTSRNISLKQSR